MKQIVKNMFFFMMLLTIFSSPENILGMDNLNKSTTTTDAALLQSIAEQQQKEKLPIQPSQDASNQKKTLKELFKEKAQNTWKHITLHKKNIFGYLQRSLPGE